MNKSILMSTQPQWVCKILNGEKTIEVRKKFPKDYVGWVYIYCTKGKEQLYSDFTEDGLQFFIDNKAYGINILNGKVVARFWCNKVERFEFETISRDIDGYWWDNGKAVEHSFITKQCCLTTDEFKKYIEYGGGYAIHISRLEVFDKPKGINELMKPHTEIDIAQVKCPKKDKGMCNWGMSIKQNKWIGCNKFRLTKAPQSWQFIEGE